MSRPTLVSATPARNRGARGLTWYWRRLRVMSIPEITHRAVQTADLVYLRLAGSLRSRSRGMLPAPLAFCAATQSQLPEPPLDTEILAHARDRLLEGRLATNVPGWQWSTDSDVWHRTPDTGALWPRRFFGGIDYRPGNPLGDIRQLWEPSRLQQVFELAAIAAREDGPVRAHALDLLRRQLCSWVEQNPPLLGPHYVSAMECGLRLIAVCYALDAARPWLPGDDPCREAVARIARSHGPLIARRLSLYSSRGNHTVAEAAALVHAGLLFPELAGANRWVHRGTALLAAEAEHQVLADGGGVEQATGYHLANLQLIALTVRLLEHRRLPVNPALEHALDSGIMFLHELGWPDGRLPAIGDGDDGQALSMAHRLVPNRDRPPQTGQLRHFSESGYTTLALEGPRHVLVTLDHGPLGMPPACGHGHADALALLLKVGDTPVLVDPGTGSYADTAGWRRYFRGTAAHNTVTVDGRDQAPQSGPFQWSRAYRAELVEACETGAGTGRLLLRHDGYADAGVLHWRCVAWDRHGWLVVRDVLTGNGVHTLQAHWHVGVPARRIDNHAVELDLPGGPAHMTFHGGMVSVHRGESDPMAGWHSPRYGMCEPSTTIRLAGETALPHHLTTVIRVGDAGPEDHHLEESLQWLTAHLP